MPSPSVCEQMQWTTSPSDMVSVPSFISPGGVLGADLALFLLILTVWREESVCPAEGEAGGDSASDRSLLGRDLELAGSFGVSGRETDSFTEESAPSTCRKER